MTQFPKKSKVIYMQWEASNISAYDMNSIQDNLIMRFKWNMTSKYIWHCFWFMNDSHRTNSFCFLSIHHFTSINQPESWRKLIGGNQYARIFSCCFVSGTENRQNAKSIPAWIRRKTGQRFHGICIFSENLKRNIGIVNFLQKRMFCKCHPNTVSLVSLHKSIWGNQDAWPF